MFGGVAVDVFVLVDVFAFVAVFAAVLGVALLWSPDISEVSLLSWQSTSCHHPGTLRYNSKSWMFKHASASASES